jgi:hypothetical protein
VQTISFLAVCGKTLLHSHVQFVNLFVLFHFYSRHQSYTHLKYLDTFCTYIDKHRVRSGTMLTTLIQHGFRSQAALLESGDKNNTILRNAGDFVYPQTWSTSRKTRIFSSTAVRTSNTAILKLSMCLFKQYSVAAWGGGGDKFQLHAPSILNLGTRFLRVVRFTSRRLLSRGNSHRYHLNRRPGGRSGSFEKG